MTRKHGVLFAVFAALAVFAVLGAFGIVAGIRSFDGALELPRLGRACTVRADGEEIAASLTIGKLSHLLSGLNRPRRR